DYFSECASIGTIEGDASATAQSNGNDCLGCGIPDTCNDLTSGNGRIMSTAGMSVNVSGWDYGVPCGASCGSCTGQYYPTFAPLQFSQFASPFTQIADFPLTGTNGWIANYQPA